MNCLPILPFSPALGTRNTAQRFLAFGQCVKCVKNAYKRFEKRRLEKERFGVGHGLLFLRLDQAHHAAHGDPDRWQWKRDHADNGDGQNDRNQKANPEGADQIGKVRSRPFRVIVTLPNMGEDNANKARNAGDEAAEIAKRDDGGLVEIKSAVWADVLIGVCCAWFGHGDPP